MTLQHIIDFIFPPQCGGCEEPGTGACERCAPRGAILRIQLPSMLVTALGPYEGRLRRAVVALKNGRRDVAHAFGARLAEIAPAHHTIVPIPTTGVRRRERGFDGCVLMARTVAELAGNATLAGLLQTRGDRQRGRDRTARLSAHGRFTWQGPEISGTRIALLDDVVTTGATLEDCAATLREAGAIVEQAIVIARA